LDSRNVYMWSQKTQYSRTSRIGKRMLLTLIWVLVCAGCATTPLATVASPTTTVSPVVLQPATATIAVSTRTPAPTLGVVQSEPTPTFISYTGLERRRFFHDVWEVVDENYVYQDFNGVDWAAAEHGYDKRIADAANTAAFYEIVQEAIDSLNDDHTRFDSPQDSAADEAIYTGSAGYAGIGVMLRDLTEQILIIRIAHGGPAEQAGVRAYDIVTAIDGRPVADFIAKNDDYGSAVRGPIGTTVTVSILRGTKHLDIPIIRNAIPGDAFPEAVATTIPGTTVQVLTIDSFNRENLRELVVEALAETSTPGVIPSGLIIDVRENGGGSIEAMSQIIGLFHDGGVLGEAVGRNETHGIEVEPGHVLPLYADIPIAVLIGEGSVSAAEMFASGMHSLRNALLVGQTSAGNTENLYPYEFDDGSVLWLAEVLFRQNDGTFVDNIGVIPDITVPENPDAYDPNNDPVIQTALQNLGQ